MTLFPHVLKTLSEEELECRGVFLAGLKAEGIASGIPYTTSVGLPQHPVFPSGGKTGAHQLWPGSGAEEV